MTNSQETKLLEYLDALLGELRAIRLSCDRCEARATAGQLVALGSTDVRAPVDLGAESPAHAASPETLSLAAATLAREADRRGRGKRGGKR